MMTVSSLSESHATFLRPSVGNTALVIQLHPIYIRPYARHLFYHICFNHCVISEIVEKVHAKQHARYLFP